ncbi:hypothetical protein RJ45_09475 [Photobacterium gaetbulicola]|uniref:Uncharacterized protein n=1 Tax=Photobacterium gaetbulicola TaxID=1295392 RepID=A0A0B9G599_9GAMM|nr:hypothetical protein [Photobacterium gaetbulicola]KHT63918.1 hypothetical protein RJ45_09475 [Photobacterium gaetbulicola]
MSLEGFFMVLTGQVERPIVINCIDTEFDALYHIFGEGPLQRQGELDKRIEFYCATHILRNGITSEDVKALAMGYLYSKEQEHSLTELEQEEFDRYCELHPDW